MRNTRKILPALVLMLVMVAVLSVCAFATEFDLTTVPGGVTKPTEGQADNGWVDSGWADIDNDTTGTWYYMGCNTFDMTTEDDVLPTFITTEEGAFYWNKAARKGVWIPSTSISANSGYNTARDKYNSGTTTYTNRVTQLATVFVDNFETIMKPLVDKKPNAGEWSFSTNGNYQPNWATLRFTREHYDNYVLKAAEIDADTTKTDEAKRTAKIELAKSLLGIRT